MGITLTTGVAYARYSDEEKHKMGKCNTQKVERKQKSKDNT